jgi:hypothetical protein
VLRTRLPVRSFPSVISPSHCTTATWNFLAQRSHARIMQGGSTRCAFLLLGFQETLGHLEALRSSENWA